MNSLPEQTMIASASQQGKEEWGERRERGEEGATAGYTKRRQQCKHVSVGDTWQSALKTDGNTRIHRSSRMRERETERERERRETGGQTEFYTEDEGLCSVWLWQKWIGFRHRRRHCHSFGLAGESDSVWVCLLACLLLPRQFLYCLSSATYWHCGQLLIHTHTNMAHTHMQAAVVTTLFFSLFLSPSGQSLHVLSLLFICQHERIFKITHSLCAAQHMQHAACD